jgi:hypothetical protein
VAAVVIPVVIAFVGHWYTQALKERELQGEFVVLAVDILRSPAIPEAEDLREWATEVVDRYSGVHLDQAARNQLVNSLTLPERPGISNAITTSEVLRDIPEEKVLEEIEARQNAGASDVRLERTRDGALAIHSTWSTRPRMVDPSSFVLRRSEHETD